MIRVNQALIKSTRQCFDDSRSDIKLRIFLFIIPYLKNDGRVTKPAYKFGDYSIMGDRARSCSRVAGDVTLYVQICSDGITRVKCIAR